MKTRLTYLLLLLCLGFATTVQAQFKIVGYQPYWAGSASSIQYSKLTHINYSFALPNWDGTLKPLSNPAFLQQIVSNAHAVNCKVFIACGGWTDNGENLDPRFEAIGANATYRNNLINGLVNLVNQYGLDGVDMDWEYPDNAANFTALMQGLHSRLSPMGKQVSAAVAVESHGTNGIQASVYPYIDFFNLMAYDGGGAHHSTYAFAEASINHWIGKGVPASKLVLGVPFYSRPGWIPYYQLLANGASPNSDTWGAEGYNGIPTIKNKTNLSKNRGCGGIMIWELSQDASGANSLLSAIYSTAGTTTNPPPTVSITSPGNGASFTASATITINANASDNGSVTQVQFYNGSTLLGSDNTSPYSFTWSGVGAGTYSLTARATDNQGATTTSSAVSVTVTNPVVQGPYGGSARAIPGTIQAEDYDVGGQGTAYSDNEAANQGGGYRPSEGVDLEACTDAGGGFNIGWTAAGEWTEYTVNVTASGTYNVTARVAAISTGRSFRIEMDGATIATINVPNTGGWQTWQAVTVNNVSLSAGQKIMRIYNVTGDFNVNSVAFASSGTTNTPPTASITAPANNATYTAPASITINANASDANGTVSNVEFLNGGTVIGSDNTAPYSFTWSNVAAGTYTVTVRATDNQGATGTSSAISVKVNNPGNQTPSVSITSPSSGTSFTAPASITINANASDNDGSIASVAFYNGTTLLNTDNTAPYSFTWSNVAAGTYSITARATDNGGAVATSSAVSVTVTNPTSGGCSGVAQYVENGGYSAGSIVQNAGGKYQCKPWPYSGWCNGAAWAYGPGTGAYWGDAWTFVSSCNARQGANTNAAGVNVIEASPVPADDNITINANGLSSSEVTLQFVSSFGEVVKTEVVKVSGNSFAQSLNISDLTSGIYVVKVLDGSEVYTLKISVK